MPKKKIVSSDSDNDDRGYMSSGKVTHTTADGERYRRTIQHPNDESGRRRRDKDVVEEAGKQELDPSDHKNQPIGKKKW